MTVDGTCWAGVWGDYDNDGFLDLFVTNAGTLGQGPGNANKLFHNNGDGTFTDMAKTEGVDMEDGVALHKTAAWADYNNDGFLISSSRMAPAAKMIMGRVQWACIFSLRIRVTQIIF